MECGLKRGWGGGGNNADEGNGLVKVWTIMMERTRFGEEKEGGVMGGGGVGGGSDGRIFFFFFWIAKGRGSGRCGGGGGDGGEGSVGDTI